MFGSNAISNALSQANSGLGAFSPKNAITYNKPIIDIKNPASLLGLSVVALVGWYTWRKFK